MRDLFEEHRENLLTAASDFDDAILELYLQGEEVPVDMLIKALRKGTISNKIVPCFCGSSFKNKGVQRLLDGIIDFLPSPLDVPPVEGLVPGKDELHNTKAQ